MTDIVSIAGDFKLEANKINQPFRDSYLKTIALSTRPALKSSSSVSNQFADNSLQLINFNLIHGELTGDINPPILSLKANGIWYFNHFILLEPPLEQAPSINLQIVIHQKGPGLARIGLFEQLAELNSKDKKSFIDNVPKGVITANYIDLIKNNSNIDLPIEIKEKIENKLFPYFEKFKAN